MAAGDLEGRCLCGAVRFRMTPPLGLVTHCHCQSCRLSHGAAFVTWTSVPPERFAFDAGEGEVVWHRTSTGVRWGGCRLCASPMLYIADQPRLDGVQVDHVYVSAGSLTSPLPDRPVAHVSWEEHLAWIEGAEALPKHRGKTGERIG